MLSEQFLERVSDFVQSAGSTLIDDHYISFTADDIAILMVHNPGVGGGRPINLRGMHLSQAPLPRRKQGLYGASQDLLKDSSGNLQGLGTRCGGNGGR
jgi:fructose 1,6-bisphosphate aldolase/phosphatase